jgi:hypothetical protein
MARSLTSALSDLIRKEPTPAELHAAFIGLEPHALRGAALAAAAQLDFALTVTLTVKLRPLDRTEYNYLFGPDGPYATTHNRIHILYSLGIIGRRSKKELQLLQRIRNVFAHAVVPVDYDTAAIADACNSLETIVLFDEYANPEYYPSEDFPWHTAKDKYTTSLRIYADRLFVYHGEETNPTTDIKDGLLLSNLRPTPLP